MPRIELPCAATRTVLPRLRAGVIDSSQYGRQRSTVSFRHSDLGISASGMCAYLLSLPGQCSELVSISGGGVASARAQSSEAAHGALPLSERAAAVIARVRRA